MRWPFKSRYVALLEEERERLLAENSNLQMKLEQARRALLITSNSPAAQTYMNREEPREKPKRPERLADIAGTWSEYESQWSVHLDHDDITRFASTCQFCKAQLDAKNEQKEKERKGISVVESGKAS